MHHLMEDNITDDDLESLISFLKTKPKLTQGKKVIELEKQWSDWLGVKHSVFVNSGSSANLISLATLRNLFGEGEVIVPPLTWVSDIAAILQNGFTPKFVDIGLDNLCMKSEDIIANIGADTKAIFMTYAQGFNGLTDDLINFLSNEDIVLIEDVCESHGATHNSQKLGSFGLMSNFSFYYAHHMSTIEGGMVCTNDNQVYEMLRMYRSHGLVRESTDQKLRDQYLSESNQLNPEFIFAFPAYNVRNTEIGAVIGLNQLKRLDDNIKKRTDNLYYFLENLNSDIYKTDFDLRGSSNYAFNIILNKGDFSYRDLVEEALSKNKIEFRRGSAGGGNQIRQPYLKGIVEEGYWRKFPNTEHIHHFGWYIGNYPELAKKKIDGILSVLNNI